MIESEQQAQRFLPPRSSHLLELSIHADAKDHDYVLREIMRPILAECKESGILVGGFFRRREASTPAGISFCLALTDQLACSTIVNLLTAALENGNAGSNFKVEMATDPGLSDLDNLFTGLAARTFVEQFFFEISGFVLDLLSQCVDGKAKAQIAFDIMAAHVWVVSRSLYPRTTVPYPVCFVSYRSHADGFFIMSKSPEATRANFESRYAQNAASLKQRLAGLLAQLAGSGPVISPLANVWGVHVAKWCLLVLNKIRSSELAFALSEEDPSLYLGDRYDLSVSSFQQEIQNNAAYRVLMNTDPNFLAMRVMMSFLYWSLQQAGVRLVERYFLCHCVSRCFEEMFDVDVCASIRAYSQT